MSAATLISSSTAVRIACSSASVATPSFTRRWGKRTRQSRLASSWRSWGGLYSTSSSDSECEYGRVTCACTSAGPLRCQDRKSTRLNSSHVESSYAVFCLKKKKIKDDIVFMNKKNKSETKYTSQSFRI